MAAAVAVTVAVSHWPCSPFPRFPGHRQRDALVLVAISRPVSGNLAYADPPYPGNAWLYWDQPDYGGEVDLAALIARLESYAGWALSTSAQALPSVLALARRASG